jgi:hypothetical protein
MCGIKSVVQSSTQATLVGPVGVRTASIIEWTGHLTELNAWVWRYSPFEEVFVIA